MFRDTETFDQDLSSWDVSRVRRMQSMFDGAKSFNSSLDNWTQGKDLADGCDLYSMFHDTEVFDQDLSSWDVSRVRRMQNMVHGAKSFNSPLDNWAPGKDLANGCNLYSMFKESEVFNQNLSSWDVSRVHSLGTMFEKSKAFNSPLDNWTPGKDLENGCDLYGMFWFAEVFDQDLSSWDVSKVNDMSYMFRNTKVFNSSLEGWTPGKDLIDGCDLYRMFEDAAVFDQDLSSWDISSVTSMYSMLDNSVLSMAHDDATLIGWATQVNIPQNLSLGAAGLKFCESQSERQSLIDDHGWTIAGDELGCASIIPSPANILYVNQNVDQDVADYTGSGDSWDNAIPELADALQWAREHVENHLWDFYDPLMIFVARGTYLPKYSPEDGITDPANPTDHRDKTFLLVKNVQLYGGFAGTESDLEDRDWEAHETILSGDLGTPNDDSDNAYHVVVSTGDAGKALLDGFVVQDGNANVLETIPVDGLTNIERYAGGGIHFSQSSPALTNITLRNNNAHDGGGIHHYLSSSILTNVTIENNTVANNGGGIHHSSSSPILINVKIGNNTATNGGGIFNWDSSSPVLTNVEISGNTADFGGGMYNNSSFPVLTNVTISGNVAQSEGGGMFNIISSSPQIYNTIIWGNTAPDEGINIYNDDSSSKPEFYHSLLEGSGGSADWEDYFGSDQGGNIDADPLFTDPANGDYRLQACSPAIDAGSNSHYVDLDEDTKDLAGHPRVYDFGEGTIDMR